MTSTTTATMTKAVTTETIADAFARTAREHASREALADGVRTLTYEELDARTNQIGRAFQERALRSGQRVGVHLDRSLATYQVFLGALKAGLVVVPLHPGHPGEHKSRMCRIAEPVVTVVDSDTAVDGIPESACLEVTDLLDSAESLPADPVAAELTVDSPAFVLFTSGSTGSPKGVVIAHRGIARVSRHLTGYTPGPDDRFLQLAQPSFAASTTDIWTCLLRGGRLSVPPQEIPPLGELARLIARERITVLNLPVGLFNLLVEHHLETVAQARTVIVSGDFPSSAHLERALEVVGGDLFNAFGCTENSALTAVHKITAADLSDAEVPVGRPMPTVDMTVRDEDLAECPPGQIGELCIAGQGLALGYMGDQELTDRKFVDHGGERLLRTGDLAKTTQAGEIVLAGRTDQMLKVRGFRVEPRHVEVTAETFPGVARAVAQAAPSDATTDQLILWCVPTAGREVVEGDILSHLREHLPDYLVPSSVLVLESFPLNANGKIDRQELASRSAAREGGSGNGADSAGQAPRDQLAETIRSILADLAANPEIDMDDALLDAGVTSLHLIDLGARLEDAAGVALGPDEIVDAGSVRGLADLIRSRRGG
jgi:amino acid adenylation domain-containing protein